MIVIPGIEFSTEHEGKELHVVGLFVKEEHYQRLKRRFCYDSLSGWRVLYVDRKNFDVGKHSFHQIH